MGAHQEAVRLAHGVLSSPEDQKTADIIECVQGVFHNVFYDEEERMSYPQDSDEEYDPSKHSHGTASICFASIGLEGLMLYLFA